MRRIAIALTLLAGCFGEAPDTKTASTAVAPMTTSDEESSSSGAGESSSSEESSSTGDLDPRECPEWCAMGCDLISGAWAECRCTIDHECSDGLACEGWMADPYTFGHCR